MSHCVPRWDNNHHPNPNPNPNPPASTSKATELTYSRHLDSKISNSAPEVPMLYRLDYEVAELTWENGQLGLHGLGQPRLSGSSGTLESVVNQATCFFNPSFNDKPLEYFPQGNELAPWFSNQGAAAAVSVSATMTMDAIVPLCFNSNNDNNRAADGSLTLIESFSDGMSSPAGNGERQGLRQVPVVAQDRSTRSEYSANITCTEKDRGTAFTSTSIRSDDNTSSGIPYTDVTGDDHDSVCQSTPFTRDYGGSGENKKKGSRSMKRSRASAIHNQSERKRRDKISQRMKTLQKMVPNSNKIDKASMLDEVIEYLKQLQAQVSMINRMNMPQMMMPMSFNQQALQMSMMSPIGAAMGMNAAAMAAGLLHPSAFMPIPPPWDAALAMMPDPMPTFLACQQSQPMTMDQYRMMAILYQQIQQAHTPNSKS